MRLSNTEAVLPARTVQALGGPKAVEQLIEQTNGKPPVRGGLREGGRYFTGTGGDTIDKNELRPEFRGNAAGQPVTPAANPGAQATQNAAAQHHMNKMPDADPVRAQQAAQANAQANAAGPKPWNPTNPNYAKGGPSPEAAKFAEAGAPKPAAPGSKVSSGAKNIGVKALKGAGYTMAAAGGAADVVDVATDDKMSKLDVATEVARQAGHWGSAGVGAKVGGTAGVAAGALTGPFAPVVSPALGALGALAGGTAGYFGADKLMDLGSGETAPSQRSNGVVTKTLEKVGLGKGSEKVTNTSTTPATSSSILTPEQVAAAKEAHENVMAGGNGNGAVAPIGIDKKLLPIPPVVGGKLDETVKAAEKK